MAVTYARMIGKKFLLRMCGIRGLFHKSIVFYDTKKLVYFTIKSFPENDRKKCCTNKILNLEVS